MLTPLQLFHGAVLTLSLKLKHITNLGQATGNTVVSEDYGGGLAEVKAQVESGNVTRDVDVELSDALQGCDGGILEESMHQHLPPAQMEHPPLKTLWMAL